MILWRLGSTTRAYLPDDLSGAGAASYPGRWNDSGQRVVYAASTLAMAVLETAAHVDDSALPMNRYVVEITVPDDCWEESRVKYESASLPIGWDAIPSGQIALDIGSRWYVSAKHMFLEVPSVIVQEEYVVVINAAMPAIQRLSARAVRRYEYNSLFRR